MLHVLRHQELNEFTIQAYLGPTKWNSDSCLSSQKKSQNC